ncbi:sensor histidine kinase [Phytohabitans sp. LJ34]|uniref:sensor histidine kinase n=1 Tax=Phytohabitans sp. LJ34 TaxID=3452217 RepID=UPI003F8B0C65
MIIWLSLGIGAALLAVAVLILLALRRRAWPDGTVPARLLGLLLAAAATGLLAVALRLVTGPGGVPDRLAVLSVVVLLPTALVLYPDDKPPAGLGWTPVAVVALCGGMGLVYPGLFAKSGLGELVAYLLVLAAQWWRFEHTDVAGRRALQWLALGALPGPLLAAMASFAISDVLAAVLDLAVWTVFLACFCVGLAAPGVRDVRAITLSVGVHAAGGLLVLAVFASVISLIDTVAGDRVVLSPGALGLVAAACAMGYPPVSRLLRQVVELLLFGARSDPIEAASTVGERLGDDPVPALRSLRESLALPYAALVDPAGQAVAVSGRPPESAVRRALTVADGTLGYLDVGLRPGQQALLRTDEQVVAVLAPALAQLMQARRFRADLQASRASIVAAVEEERRRLRRDLHDGLGPRLTGVAYAADAARNLLHRNPARAAELLVSVRAEAGEAITDVRRLVEGLRPPSLDQVGLEQTVRQHARHLLRPDGGPIEVDVRVPAPLPGLGAAVEVTAYRIVVEALTNAARHSGGHHATVTLCLEDGADDKVLAIEVRDDGRSGEQWVPGFGLTSMRERAEMLGGTLQAHVDGTGGVVSARLPLEAGRG